MKRATGDVLILNSLNETTLARFCDDGQIDKSAENALCVGSPSVAATICLLAPTPAANVRNDDAGES